MVPVVPILGILVSSYLMISLPTETWVRLVVWLVIGLIIYFSYSARHSKVQSTPVVEKAVSGD